jgi:hypothetical protein
MKAFTLLFMFLSASLFLRAGTIVETRVDNPPPQVAFNTFSHFEVAKITMGPPYAGQDANEKALKKIQQNFDLRVNALLEKWNKAAPAGGKTLVIQPRIDQIKFINGTARFWAGGLAGDSGVILKIQFIDKDTGKVVAEPEFYQRANRRGGAWSMGATDNNMLLRITEVSTKYISANYEKAVGGPTGLD